ncbi:hypothetical protein F4779DRAFT_606687 [Xylariaceae sp. FL0662B]|nr:hypothetical protein F4779DRAFT_606687 [Xylariaceae sp. FL0662B]
MPAIRGIHHLTTEQRQRCRILYFDALKTVKEINKITGYSEKQIKTAVRARTAERGVSSGRPSRKELEEA